MRRFAAVALLACIALPGAAAELNCGQMLADVAAKKPGKEIVADAQRQLGELGFDTGGVDGLLGSKTRAALLRFCGKAEFALSDDMLLMLRNHADIRKVHPDWTRTLASKSFLEWSAKQKDAAEVARVRQSGGAAAVIAVLDRYQKRRISVPHSGSGGDTPVSYMLTKDDFEQLRSREAVSKLMAKLLAASYADQDAFEAASGKALKGVSDSSEYVQLAEKYAVQQSSFRISAKSFDELKVANVPEYVLQAIAGMKDLNYPGDAIDEAVEVELGKLTDSAMAFKPQMVALAVISPTGASLDEGALEKFAEAQKGDPLAAAILAKLRELKGVKYRDDKALAWAMQAVLSELAKQIDNSRAVILAHVEEVSEYVFSGERAKQIDQKIKESTVPEIYLEMIAGMQDADYPDAELFWLASKARVAMAASRNMIGKSIREVFDEHEPDKVMPPLLDKLKAAKLPPALLALLGALQGRQFDDAKALETEIDGLLGQLSSLYEQYRPLVIAQARKTHPFDKTKIIQWSGESCNCVYNNLAGEVYGFYPYWLAGEKQVIDFSVQTRIGYYGLSFDDKGNIPQSARWSELDSGFIREARTYGSKVDLVIYRDDWRSWEQTGSEEKSALFESLAANIAGLLATPLTDTFSKIKPYISLGTAPVAVMGDGVTLYFSGYPQDAKSIAAFKKFIGTLRNSLDSGGRKYALNIMFRSSEIGQGIYDYDSLIELMGPPAASGNKSNGLFLVLLQEPTTKGKKELRLKIEDGLHGGNRMRLLRNVAMVLTYDGRSVDQLTDDVIYAKDNFGGIGFWTQPVASGVAETDSQSAVGNVLQKNFMDAVNGETALKPAVCQYICPNRWVFRIAWEIFILILLASIPLYLSACDWRNFFDRYFIRFIAAVVVPALLLTFALLFCDPSWEKISKGNGILIFVIAAVLAYSIWSYHDKKRKADLP